MTHLIEAGKLCSIDYGISGHIWTNPSPQTRNAFFPAWQTAPLEVSSIHIRQKKNIGCDLQESVATVQSRWVFDSRGAGDGIRINAIIKNESSCGCHLDIM